MCDAGHSDRHCAGFPSSAAPVPGRILPSTSRSASLEVCETLGEGDGELACALSTATILTVVHCHTLALQRTDSPSKAQPATGEVDALIRQVLADRIVAKDIPDFGLLGGAKRIAVQSDVVGLPLPLGKDALPVLEGYELRLISTGEAQAEAERTNANVHFIAIQNPKIFGNRESIDWSGLRDGSESDSIKMCCCSRSLEYRLAEGHWVFVRWHNDGICH